jgi:hypothetical protein
LNKTDEVRLVLSLLDYLNLRRVRLAHPVAVSSLGVAQATFLNVCSLIQGIGQFLPKPVKQSGTDSNAP